MTCPAVKTSWLVELEGKDVARALEQLDASHDRLAADLQPRVCWVVAYTHFPRTSTRMSDTAVRLAQRGIRLKWGEHEVTDVVP